MSIIIPSVLPTSAAANAARASNSAPGEGYALAGKLGPAATVEISPGARQAASGGREHTPKHGARPLNIIWGDSPR